MHGVLAIGIGSVHRMMGDLGTSGDRRDCTRAGIREVAIATLHTYHDIAEASIRVVAKIAACPASRMFVG
jgi:hypothetical protein